MSQPPLARDIPKTCASCSMKTAREPKNRIEVAEYLTDQDLERLCDVIELLDSWDKALQIKEQNNNTLTEEGSNEY